MTTIRQFMHLAYLAALTLAAAGAAAQAPTVPTAGAAATPLAAKAAVKPVAKPVTADKPVWSQLTPAQQTALEPLHAEWDPMAGVRKQKWLELANRYASMKPEEQARVHERMRDWVKLTPEQRNLARQNYTQSKTIAPSNKSADWESYKQLPDEQKQKLAEQAARKQPAKLPATKAPAQAMPPAPQAAACPAGTVKNGAAAVPACVAAAAVTATAPVLIAPHAPVPASNAN